MQILLFAGKLVKTKNQRQNFDVLVTWRLLISQKKGASDFSDALGYIPRTSLKSLTAGQ